MLKPDEGIMTKHRDVNNEDHAGNKQDKKPDE